jgi:hypothetical protein
VLLCTLLYATLFPEWSLRTHTLWHAAFRRRNPRAHPVLTECGLRREDLGTREMFSCPANRNARLSEYSPVDRMLFALRAQIFCALSARRVDEATRSMNHRLELP